MPEKYTHFVPDETPQQFTNFVPDDSAETSQPPQQPSIAKAFQGAVDKAATTEPVTGFKSVLNNLGAGATRLTLSPLAHPVQFAGGLVKTLAAGMGDQQAKNELVQGMVKPFLENPSGEAVAAVPQAAMALIGGRTAAAEEIPSGTIPLAKNLGERFGGYRSPVIPTPLQAASKAAEAIRPPGGIMPDFEQNLATNLPKIKAFASETGNPLHSQWETSAAARELANKGLSHFKTNFMDPIQNEQISMRSVPEYQGPVSGEGRMTTLGQIEKRLGQINDIQRAAKGKTQGAVMTALEKQGLEEEAGKLRSILYQEIGTRTGVDPNVIRDLRQSYGQQFDIADTIDAARRARLGQTGASAEMGGTVPFSKTGILEKAMQGIRGGQDYIANARLRKAMQAFEPEKVEYPSPNSVESPSPVREPLAKQVGIQPEPNPLRPVVMEPPLDYAQSLRNKIRARVGEGRANSMPKPEPPKQPDPLDRLLDRARETQSQARTLKRKKS